MGLRGDEGVKGRMCSAERVRGGEVRFNGGGLREVKELERGEVAAGSSMGVFSGVTSEGKGPSRGFAGDGGRDGMVGRRGDT